MNNEERKYFWKVLCSLNGNNIGDECKKLMDGIKCPSYSYRFRTISDNSLDALRLNKLFFSSADYYDDPFDSYSYIDWNRVFDETDQK